MNGQDRALGMPLAQDVRWRARIADQITGAMPADEGGIARGQDDPILPQRQLDRIERGGVRFRIAFVGNLDMQHLTGMPSARLLCAPARQARSCRIELRDRAASIGHDDAVGDGAQRDLGALLLLLPPCEQTFAFMLRLLQFLNCHADAVEHQLLRSLVAPPRGPKPGPGNNRREFS